jgi:hypothetical protein
MGVKTVEIELCTYITYSTRILRTLMEKKVHISATELNKYPELKDVFWGMCAESIEKNTEWVSVEESLVFLNND